MKNEEAESLLKKYITNNADPNEQSIVDKWYEQLSVESDSVLNETFKTQQIQEIKSMLPGVQRRKTLRMWYRITAAACLALFSVAVIYFNNESPQKSSVLISDGLILPGKNAAVLTLADGRTINLDDAVKGKVAEQSGVIITKTPEGELVYSISKTGDFAQYSSSKLNEISTPKGGQYQVILPDGTKVWLNAASSLKYPPVFPKKDRTVELSGEAYFEVAHEALRQFKVKTISQVIEVLGTHFNIKTYETEDLSQTTLIQGSVRVHGVGHARNSKTYTLKPGQEYNVNKITGQASVGIANISAAIAWKNGYFSFQGQDLKTVMQNIARWYDVEVVYEKEPSNIVFEEGRISRSTSIKEVLEILELTGGIQFKINERRIIVK